MILRRLTEIAVITRCRSYLRVVAVHPLVLRADQAEGGGVFGSWLGDVGGAVVGQSFDPVRCFCRAEETLDTGDHLAAYHSAGDTRIGHSRRAMSSRSQQDDEQLRTTSPFRTWSSRWSEHRRWLDVDGRLAVLAQLAIHQGCPAAVAVSQPLIHHRADQRQERSVLVLSLWYARFRPAARSYR